MDPVEKREDNPSLALSNPNPPISRERSDDGRGSPDRREGRRLSEGTWQKQKLQVLKSIQRNKITMLNLFINSFFK